MEPLLASWERKTHPAQLRLRAYLDDLAAALGPLPEVTPGLYLHMDIDVRDPGRLLRHYDLENYLTPVVAHLGPARFCRVSAVKRVGGGSQVQVGIAGLAPPPAPSVWASFSYAAGSGVQTPRWKAGLQAALAAARPPSLPAGPVAVQLAFRCHPARNWVALWKPAGDAMGPVLDDPFVPGRFNPADDRIVDLTFHRHLDPAAGHDVAVGMWWRPVGSAESGLSA